MLTRPPMRLPFRWIAGVALAGLLAGGWWFYREATISSERLLEQARLALGQERYAAAERLAQRVLRRSPADAPALVVAGEAARKQLRPQDALAFYSRLPPNNDEATLAGLRAQAELLTDLGRASDAERC